MKKYTLLFLYSVYFSIFSFGQGIYKSADDFRNNIYYLSSTNGEKVKINSGNIFKENIVNVKVGNKKIQLNKSEYYGFRDEKNRVFRFYENQTYHLLNPTEKIFIYRKKVLGGPKGNLTTYKYYFSLTPESNLVELTTFNLKTIYKSNPTLLEKIDLHFKNDVELAEFDSFTNKFKLNNVLN